MDRWESGQEDHGGLADAGQVAAPQVWDQQGAVQFASLGQQARLVTLTPDNDVTTNSFTSGRTIRFTLPNEPEEFVVFSNSGLEVDINAITGTLMRMEDSLADLIQSVKVEIGGSSGEEWQQLDIPEILGLQGKFMSEHWKETEGRPGGWGNESQRIIDLEAAGKRRTIMLPDLKHPLLMTDIAWPLGYVKQGGGGVCRITFTLADPLDSTVSSAGTPLVTLENIRLHLWVLKNTEMMQALESGVAREQIRPAIEFLEEPITSGKLNVNQPVATNHRRVFKVVTAFMLDSLKNSGTAYSNSTFRRDNIDTMQFWYGKHPMPEIPMDVTNPTLPYLLNHIGNTKATEYDRKMAYIGENFHADFDEIGALDSDTVFVMPFGEQHDGVATGVEFTTMNPFRIQTKFNSSGASAALLQRIWVFYNVVVHASKAHGWEINEYSDSEANNL